MLAGNAGDTPSQIFAPNLDPYLPNSPSTASHIITPHNPKITPQAPTKLLWVPSRTALGHSLRAHKGTLMAVHRKVTRRTPAATFRKV